MNIVERITSSDLDKGNQIVKLWVVVMLNYRQPLSDAAWKAIEGLTDRDTVEAIAMITGFRTAMDITLIDQDRLEGLLNEKANW